MWLMTFCFKNDKITSFIITNVTIYFNVYYVVLRVVFEIVYEVWNPTKLHDWDKYNVSQLLINTYVIENAVTSSAILYEAVIFWIFYRLLLILIIQWLQKWRQVAGYMIVKLIQTLTINEALLSNCVLNKCTYEQFSKRMEYTLVIIDRRRRLPAVIMELPLLLDLSTF